MRIAQRMHEIANAQAAGLRHHVGEQRITGDIERHSEEEVAAALVQLATESAYLSRLRGERHIELEQRMAGHERHLRKIGDVPGRHDQSA